MARTGAGVELLAGPLMAISSFIVQLPAMKRRRVILLKGRTRSNVLPSNFTERRTRVDMKRAALVQTYRGQ